MSLSLKPLAHFQGRPGPLLLIVMDGIGIAADHPGNAVTRAKTPVLDGLMQSKLYRTLQAHGRAVGLPSDDDMGNSEVGHNALGAGRVFAQGAKLVNQAIASGDIFVGENWQRVESIGQADNGTHTVHFLGLLSDGNVHSHIKHLLALIDRCAEKSIQHVRVHAILDGRDVAGRSALEYIDTLEARLQQHRQAGLDYCIASGGGRMQITMDRYNADWSMVERGYQCHVLAQGRQFASAREAVETLYAENPDTGDQYLPAFIVESPTGTLSPIVDGDAVVLFNFRGDRAIEISRALTDESLDEFKRGRRPDIFFCGMLEYDGDLHIPKHYLVDPPAIDRVMVEYLCAEGLHSFAISETQKFGHVTFFWNGNRSGYIDPELEFYQEIPSDIIPFDQAPLMKATDIKDATLKALNDKPRFGRINFANGDMVGHTGVFDSALAAVAIVDQCVGELIDAVKKQNGIVIVTADHGNADEMFKQVGSDQVVKTAHTLAPVPFAIIDHGYDNEYHWREDLTDAGLANVAATVFSLLGYQAPNDYEPSLIEFKQS